MVNFLGIKQNTSQFLFDTAIEVERSEPPVEPGTIIPKGFINFGTNTPHFKIFPGYFLGDISILDHRKNFIFTEIFPHIEF